MAVPTEVVKDQNMTYGLPEAPIREKDHGLAIRGRASLSFTQEELDYVKEVTQEWWKEEQEAT